MAGIDRRTRTLFFTTSPRTPMKMVPEIELLARDYAGKQWARNPKLQEDFMANLFKQDFFMSSKPPKPRQPRNPSSPPLRPNPPPTPLNRKSR